MVGWHHWLNGREFEQAPGDGGGQGSLASYSTSGCKESVTAEEMNYNRKTSIYWVASVGESLWITRWMSGINMCVCVCPPSLQSCLTLWDPKDWSLPGSSVHEDRQEYWSGLPCLPPGDLPDPGIKPESLMSPALAGGFFTTSASWKGHN